MKNALISQYEASLRMLMDVIEKCPGSLWDDNSYESAYWRIVYHALFYTALYLSKDEKQFVSWSRHIANYNVLGPLSHDKQPIVITETYQKADLLNYAQSISDSLDTIVTDNFDFGSGFSWLPMNKLELHIYNIRHLQHHTGQLIERLHQNGISGINWIGRG